MSEPKCPTREKNSRFHPMRIGLKNEDVREKLYTEMDLS